MAQTSIGVAVLGMGVVGSGVVEALLTRQRALTERLGRPIELRRVLVRDLNKSRSVPVPSSLLTDDVSLALDDPDIHIVTELLGGEHPALGYIQQAIAKGKHVVTANKEVIAKHGRELAEAANAAGVSLLYEASVGGGIPVVAPFRDSLVANDITGIKAIINGTTNYILTAMAEQGTPFEAALAEAQRLGYAEPVPDNDILGHDAAYKLCILASLGFGSSVLPEQVYREGISSLHPNDFRYAAELGYRIKLLAIAKVGPAGIEARVHPTMIPQTTILAQVNGVFNAVRVEGDLTGPVLFWGRGAGSAPTTSAVVADIMTAASGRASDRSAPAPRRSLPVVPISDIRTRYYLRIQIVDSFGVLAKIAKVLGDHEISIASVVQKETITDLNTAEIVLMTHLAGERAMQAALTELRGVGTFRELSSFIRVED